MNKAEAELEWERLQREHPDRDRLVFDLHELPNGEWEVIVLGETAAAERGLSARA